MPLRRELRAIASNAAHHGNVHSSRSRPSSETERPGQTPSTVLTVQRAMLHALDRDCQVRSEFIRRRWQRSA